MAWYMHALTIKSGGVKHVSVKYRQSYIRGAFNIVAARLSYVEKSY